MFKRIHFLNGNSMVININTIIQVSSSYESHSFTPVVVIETVNGKSIERLSNDTKLEKEHLEAQLLAFTDPPIRNLNANLPKTEETEETFTPSAEDVKRYMAKAKRF